MKKLVLCLFLVLFVSGCVSHVKSSVTRFHTMDETNSGKTFMVVPYEEQVGDLEFQTYAKRVEIKLAELGYQPVSAWDDAAYAVFLQYGIDDGREVAYSEPVYGQTGGGTTYHSGYMNSLNGGTSFSGTSYETPTYGVVGAETKTATIYRRKLSLAITDIAKSTDGNVVDIFQGEVISEGTNKSFAAVSDCLINAMFEGFPGESGHSQNVRVPSASCMK